MNLRNKLYDSPRCPAPTSGRASQSLGWRGRLATVDEALTGEWESSTYLSTIARIILPFPIFRGRCTPLEADSAAASSKARRSRSLAKQDPSFCTIETLRLHVLQWLPAPSRQHLTSFTETPLTLNVDSINASSRYQYGSLRLALCFVIRPTSVGERQIPTSLWRSLVSRVSRVSFLRTRHIVDQNPSGSQTEVVIREIHTFGAFALFPAELTRTADDPSLGKAHHTSLVTLSWMVILELLTVVFHVSFRRRRAGRCRRCRCYFSCCCCRWPPPGHPVVKALG